MLAPLLAGTSKAGLSPLYQKADARLVSRIAEGDEIAVGAFVDRWMPSLFQFTDKLRLTEQDGDVVAEEVFRRVMFEAPRFAARPEKFQDWLRGTIRDCTAATLLKTQRRHSDSSGIASLSATAMSCLQLLSESRVSEALAFLNSLTPYRFTAVYRIEGMTISNVHMFDRNTGPGVDASVSPVSQTYCLWIQETLSVVQMSDSLADQRAMGHPKQLVIRSYCGGPICSAAGDLLGTVCHFDYESRVTPPMVVEDLAAVGPMLAGVVG